MLLMGFKSGGAQPCCVATEYLTLKMPLGLGQGASSLWPVLDSPCISLGV